jgi:hypothetical protein
MHPLSDERLTDPTAAAIRAALRRACAAANGRRKTGTVNLNDQNTASLAKRVGGEREGAYTQHGTRSSSDTAKLVLAWWTAPGGRKLVRIRSWREPWREYVLDPNHPARVELREFENRPAVWHLDPERVTCVAANGSAEWVAACGCGVIGTPESLAWAGGMCGPCRDRVEELGPESVSHQPGLLAAPGFSPDTALFTPDGQLVVAVGADEYRAWDRVTGRERVRGDEGSQFTYLATRPGVSPDGRHLSLYDHNGTLTFANLRGAVGPPLITGHLQAAFWTGRPGELLVQNRDGERAVRLINAADYSESSGVRPPRVGARLGLVRPDGPRAVFTEYGNVVVARVGRGGELHPEREFRLGVGQYDRTANWTYGMSLVRFTADGERLLFASGGLPDQHLELWNPTRARALLQTVFPVHITDAQFSPDGEHLFVLGADGAVYVCHPGLLTHVRARLKWHCGQPTSLAVSPDGRTLATAGPEGVKLWPIEALLQAV